MSTLTSNPHLRLAGTEALPEAEASAEVARENQASARAELDPRDPRWVLAARAYAQLQGTAMPQEGRRRVLKTAGQLGLRPFDANLVIAIVQDGARRGQGLAETAGAVALLEPPPSRRARHARRRLEWARWIAAVATAAVANAFLIWWLTGA